ncbi:hypothetical protein CAEBREN_25120 [Caenorhabditis brenneri]|uniref:Uncharacterized protein n=1 Tax=Caenorhabditis brenneri TaxID=135651 RepID=G0N5T4_CAEBE|nr:hypothetical protein CAEBREN_25120 [Caenorhabditis brenneri]
MEVPDEIDSLLQSSYNMMLLTKQDLTVNGSRRKLILNDLQRENKQIMALQDENRQLRETTDEYLTTMRDILESHAELETTIEMQDQNKEVDDIDNIIFEMANTDLESRLKGKALKMQKMMDELEILRKSEHQALQLAVQANKNYKEMFKMACLSNPSAINVLKSAMRIINEEGANAEGHAQLDTIQYEDHEGDQDSNETIIQKSDFA